MVQQPLTSWPPPTNIGPLPPISLLHLSSSYFLLSTCHALFVLHVFTCFSTDLHIWPKMAVFALFRHIWWPYIWRFQPDSGLFRHIWGFHSPRELISRSSVVFEERVPTRNLPLTIHYSQFPKLNSPILPLLPIFTTFCQRSTQ